MANVLIVVPHDRFSDDEFEAVHSELEREGHNIQIGSSHHTEARGHFGMVIKPNVNISFVEPKDYDAVIFIGGRGVEEYFTESTIHNLIRNIYHERKLLGAIGLAVELFVFAGIISSKKVTCSPDIISKVQSAGAYYTGRPVEIDGDIITSINARTKEEFAKSIAKAIHYINPRKGLR